MKKIYIITGRTGSGKSTICERIADEFNITLLSFAKIGKKVAVDQGFNRIRECYLTMELDMFKTKMGEHFLNSIEKVLENEDSVLIDGLYLDIVVTKLKEKYLCTIIYINTTDAVRYKRIADRLLIPLDQAIAENEIKERLKNEVGINELINLVDYEIDGDVSSENVYQNVAEIIKKSIN